MVKPLRRRRRRLSLFLLRRLLLLLRRRLLFLLFLFFRRLRLFELEDEDEDEDAEEDRLVLRRRLDRFDLRRRLALAADRSLFDLLAPGQRQSLNLVNVLRDVLLCLFLPVGETEHIDMLSSVCPLASRRYAEL